MELPKVDISQDYLLAVIAAKTLTLEARENQLREALARIVDLEKTLELLRNGDKDGTAGRAGG